jgi:hypothetical protein
MAPGRENRPSLLEWLLVLERAMEGLTTLPKDAFCHR